MSQKAYQSIMDANISATQLLQEEKYNQGYQILRKIETTLKQEKEAPTIPLSQINHLLSVVTNNIGCFYYMVDKFQAAEKYLKQSIEYLSLSIPDETLLITLINLVILFIKNEKYSEASRYIEQSFTELNQLQDSQLNPKIRLFLGDQSSIMTLQSLEAILLFYRGLTFYQLAQNSNALQAWRKVLDILQQNTKSPYYILAKSKIQNLEAEDLAKLNKQNLYSSRSHLKSDTINQILEAYSDNEKSQQSFRLLSQKIKRKANQKIQKIGNELSNYPKQLWNKIEHNEKKIEINNYFSDQKKIQLQINVRDLLHQKSITSRKGEEPKVTSLSNQINKALKKRPTQHLEIIEKLNKTHNEIYKSCLAQRSNNGSKTQRGDSSISFKIQDLDIRKNDKSTHSTILHNKSQDKKSVDMRDSPDLCCSPQQFFNMLQSSVIKSQLMRSGSQGSVSQTSPLRLAQSEQPKQMNYAKTHRPMVDTYDKALKELYQHQFIQVDNKKYNRICELAQNAKQKLQTINNLLNKQQQSQQIAQLQYLEELDSPNDSCETILNID